MPEPISQNVGGALVAVTAEFTRPANTTAYTAGDVVSNDATTTTLMPFTMAVRTLGGSGYIAKARLETDKKDETAQYRLILYTRPESIVSVPADNAADTAIYADRAYRLGHIDFPAASSGADTTNSTSATALWTGAPLAITGYVGSGGGVNPNTPASSTIYGKLVNMTGTTPASGQKFSVTLTIDQN